MAPFTRIIQEFFEKYKTRLAIAIVVVLFLIAGVLAYQKYALPAYKRAVNLDYANVPRNGKKVSLMFFNASWCPHCTKVKPAWNTIESTLNNSPVNGFNIECINVDCSDPKDATSITIMSKYKVKHFPTLVLVHPDGFVLYDAKITEEGVREFVVQKTGEL